MPIPDYQTMMLPFLQIVGDGEEHSRRELIEKIGDHFDLSEEEQRELLPSGNQRKLDNRVGWVRTYFNKAGLIETTRRAHFSITDLGIKTLESSPKKIDGKYLQRFPSFVEFKRRGNKGDGNGGSVDPSQTPDEIIEMAYQKVRDDLAQEILQNVKSCSSSFFEKMIIDLLVKMGYGGSRKEAGQATKASGDEGIDGIIKEDRLGLDIIYLQAKKWENQVSRPEIQKFAGALQGQQAKKGVFITTSSFSSGAEKFTQNIENKIILIDGEELANLMIDHNIGVSPQKTFELKKIDDDYFQ